MTLNIIKGPDILPGDNVFSGKLHVSQQAAYMMFMISEVHPFLNGNGRIARVMMNAELASVGQSKIIIPTVYKEDYLGGLRQLTRKQDSDTYIKMLQRAQLFSLTINGEDMDRMQNVLTESNAFKEEEDYIPLVKSQRMPWESDEEDQTPKRGIGR